MWWLWSTGLSKAIYDHHLSSIIQVTPANFENQINKIRQTTHYVNVVQFYKQSGVVLTRWVAAVDCEEYEALCAKQNIKEYPSFVIYPPMPMPPIFVTEANTTLLQKKAARELHSNVIEVHKDNHRTFLAENPSVPKVLYFSDKKGVPTLYKALSVAFENKLLFAIIRNSETELVDQYRVKSFPTLLLVKASEKKPIPYKGALNYKEIFAFFNIYSEVFVPGGGSSLDSSATKPWMTSPFPELTAQSAKDLCLDHLGFCVILVSGQQPIGDVAKQFEALKSSYDKKNDKLKMPFSFMWLDRQKEPAWAELFSSTDKDSVVLLNPGKRKRYMAHEDEFTESAISKSIEKVLAGDGSFKRLGDKLPEFVPRANENI
ncbi:putative protein disulfide-isomerase DDB_G0275025 [Hippocampus zosterae]|uniref:putative protein disulfide-isomerase DDB_G0275025 n=1 Tax=Hippocampus zosterae TaxID=109293 RepID=UPI00223D7F79|nr:putative protein disulfide-isomerase DDB_G0275025 [Hippocampus zosterae]